MDSLEWPTVDLLTHRARTTPGRTAIIDADRGQQFTFESFSSHVDDAAAGLDATEADRLGVLLETGPAFICVLFAAMRTKKTIVPLSLRETPKELAMKIHRADVEAIVCESATESLATDIEGRPVWTVDTAGADGVESIHMHATADAVEPAVLEPDWPALIVFTSGTTGEPKGVKLTLRNLVASATASAFRLGVTRADRWLVPLPMYHLGGISPVIRSTLYGTTVVTQREFVPAATADTIESLECTGVSLVPTMIRKLLDAGWQPPETLRFALVGGAPAEESLVERSLIEGVPIYPTYGTTETASQIATATPNQVAARPGTVGRPLLGTTVTICDESGRPLEPGESGQIAVSGPTVCAGYLDDEQTDAARCEHGFLTGDVGHLDEEGRLWLADRASDEIVTGGENVDPAEVRDVLEHHPSIAAAAVVGVPDEQWGESVGALLVPSDPENPPTSADVLAHCDEHLAGYKRPRIIDLDEEIPRTVSGTVDRAEIRARLQLHGVQW